jgi:hypothetical protein
MKTMETMKTTNRYSPHYSHDDQVVTMSIDENGSWVHYTSTHLAEIERFEKIIATYDVALTRMHELVDSLTQELNTLRGMR